MALLLAGILMVMGAYRIFSYLCENAQMDAVTFLLGGACALLAVGRFSAGTGQLPAAEGAAPGAVGLSCRSSLGLIPCQGNRDMI